MQEKQKIRSAFFITFSGDCKKALALYQQCFGGELDFKVFDKPISGIKELPVVSGSLVSEKVVIYGSDLGHNEGRKIGNFMSFYVHCDDSGQRLHYLEKLDACNLGYLSGLSGQKWIEITDSYQVRWVFGI